MDTLMRQLEFSVRTGKQSNSKFKACIYENPLCDKKKCVFGGFLCKINDDFLNYFKQTSLNMALFKNLKSILIALCSILGTSAFSDVQKENISVDCSQKIATATPFLFGTCLEDLNHEVYGGLYGQMIFGERFEEISTDSISKYFEVKRGKWSTFETHTECELCAECLKDLTYSKSCVVEKKFRPSRCPLNKKDLKNRSSCTWSASV